MQYMIILKLDIKVEKLPRKIENQKEKKLQYLPETHLWCGLAYGAQLFCSSPHPRGGPSTLLAETVPHPAKTRHYLSLSSCCIQLLIQKETLPPF